MMITKSGDLSGHMGVVTESYNDSNTPPFTHTIYVETDNPKHRFMRFVIKGNAIPLPLQISWLSILKVMLLVHLEKLILTVETHIHQTKKEFITYDGTTNTQNSLIPPECCCNK